jgi:hypothetical protein
MNPGDRRLRTIAFVLVVLGVFIAGGGVLASLVLNLLLEGGGDPWTPQIRGRIRLGSEAALLGGALLAIIGCIVRYLHDRRREAERADQDGAGDRAR